jgi:hypothetical protein
MSPSSCGISTTSTRMRSRILSPRLRRQVFRQTRETASVQRSEKGSAGLADRPRSLDGEWLLHHGGADPRRRFAAAMHPELPEDAVHVALYGRNLDA